MMTEVMSQTVFQVSRQKWKIMARNPKISVVCVLISVREKLWSELKREVLMHKQKNTVHRTLKYFKDVVQDPILSVSNLVSGRDSMLLYYIFFLTSNLDHF